ncbi:MAG: PAS domain-containing protein [Oligoflexia bacterium]|nr:PAS domain-containing protein [Oligoflexia bacterium]
MSWSWSVRSPDLEKHRGRVLLVAGIRIAFLYAILLITVLYQLRQPQFFDTGGLFPFYILVITAFALNSIYLYFFENTQRLVVPTGFLFAFDTVFITALVLITGIHQSIFLFLFLVNILLCSLVFQRSGAFAIALFTSVCFSAVLIMGPTLQGQTLYYAVGLNNLAFFAVAGLSGYLSEQINFMGLELKTKTRDIKALKDINQIILENISSGLITVSNDYKVILSNKSAGRILGLGAFAGKSLNDVIPGCEELIKNRANQTSEIKGLEGRHEFRHTLQNGERILLGMSISPLADDSGGVGGFIIIFQDLTEILRLENAMRRQEKLAAVGKLAAGIAHEIRNPLASISGSIELLRDSLGPKTAEQAKLMEIMLKEVARLNGFITEFLEFVRPDQKKNEECKVVQILDEVLEIVKLNKSLPQTVTQEKRYKAQAVVIGDRNKLKQAFLNLVINAYQAMQDNPTGKLTVTTDFENDDFVVHVSDQGHGMSDQTLKRLFEPFFTTKPRGTGLGLATVHKIFEMHDAGVFVESREGNGTEFTVQFHHVTQRRAGTHESQNTGS